MNNLKEFIAYAKANQAKMQYGSAGAGSATHLGCVLLNYLIGVDITHVPYRGTGPAMQDLQGGRIDYLCEVISTAKPQIDGGTVKAIAIMTKERSPALPNVPTGIEQGTAKLEAYTWNAIFLPKGAPADVVKKLNDAAVQAMKTPAVRDRLTQLGAVIVSDDRATPEYLGQFLKERDREMGGADQGERRQRRTDGESARGTSARALTTVRHALTSGAHPSSISPFISCEKSIPPRVTIARAGSFSLPFELAVRERLAHRLLDLALGADAERLEKFPDAAVENVFVHDRLLASRIMWTRGALAGGWASPPECG